MLPIGTTLAGYRIDGVLGQGGMGTVYEATQLSLERVVALKLLAAHLSNDMAFRARFRREGQVQARQRRAAMAVEAPAHQVVERRPHAVAQAVPGVRLDPHARANGRLIAVRTR